VALGTLAPDSLSTRILERLAATVLRASDLAVALDETMADRLRQAGARRVEVVPNWADGEELRSHPGAAEAFRATHGLRDGLIVLYSGNLGMAHRFDALLDAARQLRETTAVTFLVVGHGPRLPEVEQAAREIPSLRVLPPMPREDLPALYAAADLHVVSLRDEVAGLLVPSKYAAALAAGRPVLLLGGSRTGLFREVVEKRVGWALPHEAEAIAGAIRHALVDGDDRKERGRCARRLFECRYDRRAATRRWRELLEGLMAEEGSC
jgi:glycosyltransferase involved in cell wall biosynthesis